MSRPRQLLRWYDRSRRELPWRGTRDPYAIWVSEVMLQQTRVETVRPYYERFLERYPDVGALAAAPLDDVLGSWSGLGYYRRARQLHRAAIEIDRAGAFPDTLEGLERLPGVGSYTAAAIGSMAFGLVAPAIDGNLERVLARLHVLEGPLRTAAGKRRLREVALEWLDPSRPGDGNQALMELGATICLPRAPRCAACPIADHCQALRHGTVERYPQRVRKKKLVRKRLVVVVAERRGRLLLFRRPEEADLLAGLWELPAVSREGDDEAVVEALGDRYGGSWELGPSFGRFRHTVTFRALDIEVRSGRRWNAGTVAEGVEAGWFEPREIAELPASAIVSKALARWSSKSS